MSDPNAGAGERVADGHVPSALPATPLVMSRSLGRLLGLEQVRFKLEMALPTGSWLDRVAACAVAAVRAEGRTGVAVVGIDALTLPLAVQCARGGLRLVVFNPVGDERPVSGWLSALGATVMTIEAEEPALRDVVGSALSASGLSLARPDDPPFQAGLLEVVQEIEGAAPSGTLVALPGLTGLEARWLAEAAAERRSQTVPLPFDEVRPAQVGRPYGIVGRLEGAAVRGDSAADDSIITVAVSRREADAAQRLLAHEEGLLVSRQGATGFAALVRAVREDRAKRLRERRLRDLSSSVVVLSGDVGSDATAPARSADALPARPVALADLADRLAQLLVQPPGP